jgi:hypothetical protein
MAVISVIIHPLDCLRGRFKWEKYKFIIKNATLMGQKLDQRQRYVRSNAVADASTDANDNAKDNTNINDDVDADAEADANTDADANAQGKDGTSTSTNVGVDADTEDTDLLPVSHGFEATFDLRRRR